VLPTAPAADEVASGLSDEVQTALGALPQDFRGAVVLCDVAGLPYEEIARIENVPLGTIKSRIFNARVALREQLRPYLEA